MVDYLYKWKTISSTVSDMAQEIADNWTTSQIESEIKRIEAQYNTNSTSDSIYWNGHFLDAAGNWRSPYVQKKNYEYYVLSKEEEMEMPFFYIVNSTGQVVDKAKEEADAKRKAKNWVAANKTEAYVLKPTFRYEPKDAPVEEVAL